MRLATCVLGGRTTVGVVAAADGLVHAISDLVADAPAEMVAVMEHWQELSPLLAERALLSPEGGTPLQRMRLLAPLPRPRNVLCVGWNYAEHFEEGREMRGPAAAQEIPQHPALFSKAVGSVTGPDTPIRHPAPHSQELDWEVELAVVIGRPGRDIPERRALEHVFGYTIGNDVSVRDFQRSRHGGQWFKGKSFDTHCPLGPWIVTADEIPDPQVLDIASRVNGQTKQASNTRHMVFSVARIIAELSLGMTLGPGDVILTGTPPGVGFARKPPEFLRPGDAVEMEIGGIGVLRNHVE